MKNQLTLAMLIVAGSASGVAGQCAPTWSPAAGPSSVHALAVFDEDDSGPMRPALFAGANWSFPTSEPLGLIRRWDGRRWTPLGVGMTGVGVYAVAAAYTSGVGSPQPGLYVGGQFSRAGGVAVIGVARWSDGEWHALPAGITQQVTSMSMFDEDGSGPVEASLFLGGSLRGTDKPGILRFDGKSFTLVGGSLAAWRQGLHPIVRAMTTFDDDGEGPRQAGLYVGGSYMYAGGMRMDNLARWDGKNWESLGTGMGGTVFALAVFDADDDGPQPPMLYAGGSFEWAGATQVSYLARWDGQRWSEVPGYVGGSVESLYVHDDDGDGPNKPALFIGGFFTNAGGAISNGVVKWDGLAWHGLEGGVGNFVGAHAKAFHAFDEDGDPATPAGLYVGGIFFNAGSVWSPGLARWGCPVRTCYADCDASTGLNTLDIFDFLCFQHAFVTADPYACDCDTATGPAICDMLDFLCFQRAFVAGCP